MTTRRETFAKRGPVLGAVAVALQLACAAEEQTEIPQQHPTTSGGGPTGIGGVPNAAGRPTTLGGSATGGVVTAAAGAGGRGSASHTGGSGGHSGAASSGGTGGKAAGGGAGNAGSSGSSGGASAGAAAGRGAGGVLNQPTQCDEATATLLGTMSSNIKVASNVCLKMTVPTDQTWIKKITIQPDSGMYPLPFTWSNCGTNSSGAFTANYANVVLDPVSAQCPILVKLGGSGAPINVQWWAG